MSHSKRSFFIILIPLVILAIVWEYLPEANSGDRLALLRQAAVPLGGQIIPLSAEETTDLGGARAMKIRYPFDSRDWVLIAVDGSRNSGFIHDPSYCLHGTGWECVEHRKLPLDDGSAEIMQFTRNQERMTFAFWFNDGRETFSSMLGYWSHRMMRRLTLGLSGDIPIMMSLYPLGDDAPTPENWNNATRNLIPKLLPPDNK